MYCRLQSEKVLRGVGVGLEWRVTHTRPSTTRPEFVSSVKPNVTGLFLNPIMCFLCLNFTKVTLWVRLRREERKLCVLPRHAKGKAYCVGHGCQRVPCVSGNTKHIDHLIQMHKVGPGMRTCCLSTQCTRENSH